MINNGSYGHNYKVCICEWGQQTRAPGQKPSPKEIIYIYICPYGIQCHMDRFHCKTLVILNFPTLPCSNILMPTFCKTKKLYLKLVEDEKSDTYSYIV